MVSVDKIILWSFDFLICFQLYCNFSKVLPYNLMFFCVTGQNGDLFIFVIDWKYVQNYFATLNPSAKVWVTFRILSFIKLDFVIALSCQLSLIWFEWCHSFFADVNILIVLYDRVRLLVINGINLHHQSSSQLVLLHHFR